MGAADIIILLALAAWLVFVIVRGLMGRKRCSGGCGSCCGCFRKK